MYGSEPQLLLVEKDLNYGNLMKGYFQALHFNVVMVLSSEDAFRAYAAQHFDFGIIEVNLPDGNGLSLVSRLRERNPSFPIIIVSDLTSQTDVLNGLRSGADEYIKKPFDSEELTLRVYALLRLAYPVHHFSNTPDTFEIGSFTFDVVHQTLQRPGAPEIRLRQRNRSYCVSLLCTRTMCSHVSMLLKPFGRSLVRSMRAAWMSILPSCESYCMTIRT